MIETIRLLYLTHEDKWRGPPLVAFARKYLVQSGVHNAGIYSAGISESIKKFRSTSPGICPITSEILSTEHGLDTSHKVIRHVDDLPDEWTLILAADKGIHNMACMKSNKLCDRTLVVGDYIDLEEPEIHEPHDYQKALPESERTADSGHRIMVAKADEISRLVAERIKWELGRMERKKKPIYYRSTTQDKTPHF